MVVILLFKLSRR